MACNQLCEWNIGGMACLKPIDAICPMSNMAPKEKPQTNADRIRSMSDEELADVVVCPHTGKWDLCIDACKKCRLEWLKQPAEE